MRYRIGVNCEIASRQMHLPSMIVLRVRNADLLEAQRALVREMMRAGRFVSKAALATRAGIHPTQVTRLMNLKNPAPTLLSARSLALLSEASGVPVPLGVLRPATAGQIDREALLTALEAAQKAADEAGDLEPRQIAAVVMQIYDSLIARAPLRRETARHVSEVLGDHLVAEIRRKQP